VEVYDFARGTFVGVSPTGNGEDPLMTAALSPDQVRDGLVRVRLREARMFQGSSVWVEAAGSG
jgi:hypothetical protein